MTIKLLSAGALAKEWGKSRQWVNKMAVAGRIETAATYGPMRFFLPGTARPVAMLPGRKKTVSTLSGNK